jgi:hypothetical protein
MEFLEESRLLTCIVPKGVAAGLQKALIERWQLHAANIHHARGVGRNVPLSKRGIGEQLEKEILEVVLESGIADEVFEFAYDYLELAEHPGGMIYIVTQPRSTVFRLPEIAAES